MSEGFRWGYVHMNGKGKLPLTDKIRIMEQAVAMHLTDGEKRDIEGESFDGRIWNTGKYEYFPPNFGGRRYEAEVDGSYGKATLQFLVTEHIRSGSN